MSVTRPLVLVLLVAGCEPGGDFYTEFAFDYSHPLSLVVALGRVEGPSALISDTSGGLIGVMADTSCGTVFTIAPDGTRTTRYTLLPSEGCFPSDLVEDANGTLYVATDSGSVFRLTTNNVSTVLRPIQNDHVIGLVLAPDGTLFGAAYASSGGGSVFRISPAGVVTDLYHFAGDNPSRLIRRSNGDLYGTTSYCGGANRGTVFALSPDGTFRTVHSFDGADGDSPRGLTATGADELWGTTERGGANDRGTVFRLAPDDTLTVLHSFVGYDGDYIGELIDGADGSLYGVAQLGGDFDLGTLFRIKPDGSGTVLHSFSGGAFGDQPELLTRGIAPALFGTTLDPSVLYRIDIQ
jgi:uncharacterized repeat protein (TIGR03803 family)